MTFLTLRRIIFINLLTLIMLPLETLAQALNYNNNRIACNADGNMKDNSGTPAADPDDWGGTPAALAMIAKKNLQSKLVHFSYNNWIGYPLVNDNVNEMKKSADGANRWKFNTNNFFDSTANSGQAITHLKNELAKSTASDPLYYIHMGPSEFFYLAVKQAVDSGNREALRNVYVISHSGYNDNYKVSNNHHTLSDALSYAGGVMKYTKIVDQNGTWKTGSNFSVWDWAKNSSDANLVWMYNRIKAHRFGSADVSDAGMVWWLLTGDQYGTPAKLNNFIGGRIDVGSGPSSRSSSSVATSSSGNNSATIPGRIQAENYSTQNGLQKENTTDVGGGQNLGYIENGDYAEYDVNVTATGYYEFNARVASNTSGGYIFVTSNGSNLGSVSVSNTGGWQKWVNVSTQIRLDAGRQKLRLTFSGGNTSILNLNWFDIGSSPSSSSSSQTPNSSKSSSSRQSIDQCNTTQQCKNIFGNRATDCKNSQSTQSICMCGTSPCN
jgi:hypothetical protein